MPNQQRQRTEGTVPDYRQSQHGHQDPARRWRRQAASHWRVHYVSITSGYKGVDLQKFYQPYNSKDGHIKPTKTGMALSFDEWANLSQLVDNINTAFPYLASVLPCRLGNDHMNQMGSLNCVEHQPFYTELSLQ